MMIITWKKYGGKSVQKKEAKMKKGERKYGLKHLCSKVACKNTKRKKKEGKKESQYVSWTIGWKQEIEEKGG